jgi:hypothetical protein
MTYEAPPPYAQSQPSRGGSGMAITSLVLGVLALLSSWTVIGGILLGLAAVILGLIALSKIKRGQAGGKAMAIIGIIAGALGLIIAVALIAIGASLLNSESGQNLQDCLEDAGNDQEAQAQCQREFQEELSN